MTTTTCRRGTTNGNSRGGSEDRRRRRAYLIATYRADVDGMWVAQASIVHDADCNVNDSRCDSDEWCDCTPRLIDGDVLFITAVPYGTGIPVCRCYRCGVLLDDTTVTVDRIIPGCKGGTYKRTNIRPACGPCNSETGGRTRR